MRRCSITALLLVSSVIANAQPTDSAAPPAHEWRVTVVETMPLPPLQITNPALRLVTDAITGESRVELAFTVTNLTDEEIGTNLSVWIHEFAGEAPAKSWLFDALSLTTGERIRAHKQVRIRAPYREGFDQRADTWLLISLKSAPIGDTVWEQSNPWKKSVAVMRGEVSAQLADLRYDEFMDMALDDRKAVFNYVPPDARARLVRAHLERYLASHGDALTRDQRILIEEMITTVTASLYVVPRGEEAARRLRDLETRATRLFTKTEMIDVFTLDGPKIARKPE
jgi:hypothetical protein